MTQLFTNNATSVLVDAITVVDTSIRVADPTKFPQSLAVDDFFLVTVEDLTNSLIEIMKVTAVAGDVFTVERAQENTTAFAFASGVTVEIRFTVGTLLRTPEISDENVLPTRMKQAVVSALPGAPKADTIYFVLE